MDLMRALVAADAVVPGIGAGALSILVGTYRMACECVSVGCQLTPFTPQQNDYSKSNGLTAPQYFAAAAPRFEDLAAAVTKPGDTATGLVRHVFKLITTDEVHPLRTALLVSAYGARVAVEASGARALVRLGVCVRGGVCKTRQ